MQIGTVGLGRMGANMARRLARGRIAVVGFDPGADATYTDRILAMMRKSFGGRAVVRGAGDAA